MGLRENQPGEEAEYVERLTRLMKGLPTVILVRNAGVFRGRLLGDEETTTAVEEA
jgi:hypothetical protein